MSVSKTDMEKLKIECDYGTIEISIKDQILKFDLDGGDGISYLDQKQIIEIYLFLKHYYEEIKSGGL